MDKGQDVNRRRVLKGIVATGSIGIAISLPDKWMRPIVEAIVVPAHAAASHVATSTTRTSTTTRTSSSTTTAGTSSTTTTLGGG
jgi:hypothetical protein